VHFDRAKRSNCHFFSIIELATGQQSVLRGGEWAAREG